MSRRNLSLLLTAVFVALVCAGRNPRNPNARYVAEGFAEIDEYALDRPADQELVAGAMRGMVDVLRRRGDEHTSYFRPKAAKRYRDELSGGFGGVGVRVGMLGDPPTPTIIGPPEPGTPAFYGGVKPDDRITAIDGEPIDGLSIDDIVSRMRGEVGEPVALTIGRGDPEAGEPQERTITLEREIISVPSVLGDRRRSDGSWDHLLEQDARIALVRIETFGDRTFDEFQQLLPKLEDAGMRAMVIDLRENPGGALDIAIDTCDLLLPAGAPIVETRGRNGKVMEHYAATGDFGSRTDLPLAVLINDGSASASEIMAACLQDDGRAVVVGERSFGKGTVQRLIELEAGKTMLKLTTATFWRPSGVDIHRQPGTPEDQPWGVSPDDGFEVKVSTEERIAYLKARSARDLLPIDLPEEAEPAEDDTLAETSVEASEAKEPVDLESEPLLVDPVLDRAVEHLRSLLDGSACATVARNPAA